MDIKDFSPTVPNDAVQDLISDITYNYMYLANRIFEKVGSTPHRTAALRKLLESKMTLIHGITHS